MRSGTAAASRPQCSRRAAYLRAKGRRPKPDSWKVAFIAITPRNPGEDTHRVADEVRVPYEQVVDQDAPLGVRRRAVVSSRFAVRASSAMTGGRSGILLTP